ncbi:MAG TPA: LPS-assembly protein LptD, partial [Gammaproteobacteria bacterium]|nr:LPS-assembly protein LptD [Gammaproteobacteria bacterium]
TSVLSLSRTWGSYRADANFTYLQDLENFNSPSTLQELPRLTFQGDKPLFPRTPAYLELDGEYVYFYRQQGDRYHRFFADPALSYKFQSRFGTLEPKAGVHYTQYRKVPEGASQGPQNLSRTLPHFSVKADSQVYRIWRSDGWALRHAIEPELYYLYIPYRNQDKLPVLDTKAPPLSFGDLFEMNRFSGIDRINDANQLTMALTNRLDAKWGDQTWEAALLRIGQIRYFRDRRVTLRPGAKPATRGYSNYFADFGLSPIPAVSLKGTLEYDPDRPAFALNQLDYFQSQLTIKHPAGHQLSARYLRRTTFSGGKSVPRTEEYRVSAKVNLGPAWNAFGNYRYSLLFKEPLEQRLG